MNKMERFSLRNHTNAGFEVNAFYEVEAHPKGEEHVFSNTYSKSRAGVIPFSILIQAKKP